jgi:predicted  nucleic acid-binding Zn-ribbon protein
MDTASSDQLLFKALQAEIDRLKKRLEGIEYVLREDHDKLEKLEHEHEHDHEVIERLDHTPSTSYYTGRKTIAVGL